ncbi:hypothetical protein Q8A73_018547 [Channa argus]|nr:hypothetical protein Q8A73_018547 [Channa argus]
MLNKTKRHLITSILENNFDLGLENEQQRIDFTTHILHKVKDLMRKPPKDKHEVFTLFDTSSKLESISNSKTEHGLNMTSMMQKPDRFLVGMDDTDDNEHEDVWCSWALPEEYVSTEEMDGPHADDSNNEDKEYCAFAKSKAFGLEYDVGFAPKQNISVDLLNNYLLLEVANFALAMNSSQQDFLMEILEYNFDFGLQSENDRKTFACEIMNKVKQLQLSEDAIRFSRDVFEVPRPSSPANTANQNSDYVTSELSSVVRTDECVAANCPLDSHVEAKQQAVNLYPFCKEIGLKLHVNSQPHETLDINKLTNGAMTEVISFAEKLCGTFDQICLDIIAHNFDVDLQNGNSDLAKNILAEIRVVMDKKHLFNSLYVSNKSQDTNPAGQFSALTKVYEGGSTWFNEIFVIQPCSHEKMGILGKIKNTSAIQKREKKEKTKRKQEKSLSTCERFTKRHSSGQPDEKLNTVFHRIDRKVAEGFQSYMCPLDSDDVLDSGDSENEDHLQNAPNCDGRSDSQSGSLDVLMPFLTHTDDSCNLLTVNSKVNPPFSSQPDKRELFENKAQTQRPRHVMKEEDIETESNMWKLRANRVKQILVLLDKEYWVITKGMKFGLEFNVGFGQKQNISVKSLNDTVLLRVASFALAMNSAQQDFIMEILEYNFDFGLQSESDRKTFACEIMNKVKQLQMSEDAIRFSRDVFEVPRPSSPANTANQNSDYVTSELSSVVRTDECVAANCPLDSHVEAKQQAVNLYPFCKEIGLKLHVNYRRPHKTLDFTKLTNGAMTEVTNFAERLCGTFDQICLDIITHNFDVDLQNVDSDLAKNILARIHAAIEKKRLLKFCGNVRQNMSMMEKLDLPNSKLEEAGNGCSQPSVIEHEGNPTDIEHEDELNLWLWKLRANQIQQILSVPHGEHCPFYSYSRCKKVGIDFNTDKGVKTESDTEGVNYVVPPQTPGIQEYSVKSSTIENTLVKEEQEYVPVDSYHSRVVSNTDNEMDIKQEPDP